MPARLADALLVLGIALVLVAPLGRRIVARRFDPFEPLFLFVVAYGVMFVVRPAVMIAQDRLVFYGPSGTFDVSAAFTEMLVLALLGALAFSSAYALPLARRPASRREDERAADDRRLVTGSLLLAVLGTLAFGIFLFAADGIRTLTAILGSDHSALAGAVETYRYLWLAFFVLVPAAIALLGLGLERRRKTFVACSMVLAALVLLRVIPLGNRIVLLPLVGSLVVVYYLDRRSRPSARSLAVFVAVALLSSAFISDLRGRETRGEGVGDTVARSFKPSRLGQPFTTGPDSEMAPALAAALSVIPERLPRQYGAAIFEDLVVRPIPRQLWSGKPLPPREELLSTLWPVEYARGTINSEFSVLLYFYWDFGLIGVVLGLAAYGAGARYLYEYYRAREDDLSARVLYALALWFLVIALRDSPVDTLILASFVVLPGWLIFRLARAPARSSSESLSTEARSSA